MACEWTHHISYKPGLIAVSLGHTKATVENIRTSKEFGINLCASDQSVLASVAGGYTGAKYNKVNALKELGFEFYKAKRITSLMIKGAVLNIECRCNSTLGREAPFCFYHLLSLIQIQRK